MIEKKPCPFCGGTKISLLETQDGVPCFLTCLNCGAIGPDISKVSTIEDAIKLWNSRAVVDE